MKGYIYGFDDTSFCPRPPNVQARLQAFEHAILRDLGQMAETEGGPHLGHLALSVWAEQTDHVGVAARAELARRARMEAE